MKHLGKFWLEGWRQCERTISHVPEVLSQYIELDWCWLARTVLEKPVSRKLWLDNGEYLYLSGILTLHRSKRMIRQTLSLSQSVFYLSHLFIAYFLLHIGQILMIIIISLVLEIYSKLFNLVESNDQKKKFISLKSSKNNIK